MCLETMWRYMMLVSFKDKVIDSEVVLEPHSFVGHLLCSVTQVCQEGRT